MKKSKSTILAITLALAGIVWLGVVATVLILTGSLLICWGSAICVALAIIAAELYLLVFKKQVSDQSAETNYIGNIATVCFVAITLGLNSVLVFTGLGNFNPIVFIVNIVAIICFIIFAMWAEQHSNRVAAQLDVTAQKTANTYDISRKLGELASIAENEDIRNKMLKLKEAVDYSSNISTNSTAGREAQMLQKLDEIAQLIISNADNMIISTKLTEAEMIWKLRGSAPSAGR